MKELPVNQIIQGDCLEVMKTFPDKSIDLVLTDPPYSSGARQTSQMRAKKGMNRSEKWVENWFGYDCLG